MTPESMPPPLVMPPPEPSGPKMSEFGRLFGVLYSPGAAFRDIARRPRWWVPLIVTSLVGSVFLYYYGQRVGWEAGMRQVMMQSPQAQQMTAEQMDNAIRIQATVLKYVTYATPLTTAISVLMFAAIGLFLFDTLQGGSIGLNRLMGIVAYAWMPYTVSSLLALLVLFLKDPADFDLQNPLAFNIGAFLPSDASAWMKALGQRLDLFSFWTMILMAIGVNAAAPKIGTGKAFATIMFPWFLYAFTITAIAAVTG